MRLVKVKLRSCSLRLMAAPAMLAVVLTLSASASVVTANVRPVLAIASLIADSPAALEEIFGPVLTILGAKDEADAVKIANDTPYGLAGYVSADSVETARKVGRQIRAGNVNLQGVPNERTAPS